VASAELAFDPDREQAVLVADMAALNRDSTFRAYVRGEGAALRPDGGLVFPTTREGLHQRYQELTELLGQIGVQLRVQGTAEATVSQVVADEEAFTEFSALAGAIWRGEIVVDFFASFVDVVRARLPGRTLYRLQLLSAFHLAFAQHACNFSVPGAGKTTTVLAAFTYLNALPPDDPKHVDHLLVVGPLASFKAWKDEFQTGFGRPARMRRIAGFMPVSERRSYLRGLEYQDKPTDLTVTTYPTLASTPDDFARFLKLPGRRSMVVLDEAHSIKRGDGVRAAAALALAPHAISRVVLTGTPAPNGYEDLSNLFKFLYPYRDVVGFPPTALRAMTDGTMPAGVEVLKKRLQPYYTRIRKSDLGLAPATALQEQVPMTGLHERIYTSVERVILPQLRAAASAPSSSLLRARLMRLRQAAVNPALLLRPLEEEGLFDLDGGGFSSSELEIAELVALFDPVRDLQRLARTVELARTVVAEQGKVVVWSYFLGNLELLKSSLTGAADYVEVLTGATPVQADGYGDEDDPEDEVDPATREAIIDRFHRSGETAILIANPQAVGESISLHKAARTAIYFDRDFNAGRFIQSKDRIHRYAPEPLGEVRYHLLTANGTVDQTIDTRLVLLSQKTTGCRSGAEVSLEDSFSANGG